MEKPRVDTRGLSCPQPVVLVLEALDTMKGDFEILIDSAASCDNLRRTLEGRGVAFDIREEDGDTIYAVKR